MISWYTKLSSANNRNFAPSLRTSAISLICITNKSGPRTVPCGPPYTTGTIFEVSPSTITCIVLQVRNILWSIYWWLIGSHNGQAFPANANEGLSFLLFIGDRSSGLTDSYLRTLSFLFFSQSIGLRKSSIKLELCCLHFAVFFYLHCPCFAAICYYRPY